MRTLGAGKGKGLFAIGVMNQLHREIRERQTKEQESGSRDPGDDGTSSKGSKVSKRSSWSGIANKWVPAVAAHNLWPVHTSHGLAHESYEKLKHLNVMTEEELLALRCANDRVLLISGWIVESITRKLQMGDLKVPPPIMSRVYQELSNGALGYNQALKVAMVPFPFPFAQMLALLLAFFVLICPVIVLQFTNSLLFTPLLTFFAILGYWGLNEIAVELENPFGDDANDLPMLELHHDFIDALEEALMAPPNMIDVEGFGHAAIPKELEADAAADSEEAAAAVTTQGSTPPPGPIGELPGVPKDAGDGEVGKPADESDLRDGRQ